MLALRNKKVYCEFSKTTGELLVFKDIEKQYFHINHHEMKNNPFQLEKNGRMISGYDEFTYKKFGNTSLLFMWKKKDASIKAEIQLLNDGLAFRGELHHSGSYRAIEYPILNLHKNPNLFLAHSYATGILIENPFSVFKNNDSFRFLPYPESFSGSSMQFFSIYEEDKSGLYFAAFDGEGHQKWMNIYVEDETLIASHMYGFENISEKGTISMPYNFVVRLTKGSGWEESAELYKKFALRQKWCVRGKNFGKKKTWLNDEIGYVTFGINAGYDRSRWIKKYQEDIQTKGFHILGPDWTNKPQTFYKGVPGGIEDWLPSKFNMENIKAIKEHGDKFAPFEFDYLVNTFQSDSKTLKKNLQKFPKPSYSHDKYQFSMLCPCEIFTKAFHKKRDKQLIKESGCDSIYYDISANNLIKICLKKDHAHKIGGGIELTEAYGEIYEEKKAALIKQEKKYIPIGTEQICEVYIDKLDYYQARSWGQPSSTLETWPIRNEMVTGQAKAIPMFDYVYHEYGPVRMDGWGKLVEEIGELFYYTVAKTYLWGGLYEINHEYSPMEEIDGEINPSEEHYFPFENIRYKYSDKRANYIKEFAKARVGCANSFWSYGEMLSPPKIEVPECYLNWYHYNHNPKDPSYKSKGKYKVSCLVTSAFKNYDRHIGVFVVNISDKHIETFLDVPKIISQYKGRDMKIFSLKNGEKKLLKNFSRYDEQDFTNVSFAFESRIIYMLKII